MWSVVPDMCNVVTSPPIQSSIFNWTSLRCYWRYVDNSMLLILQSWCQIHRISISLRYLNCGPGHILQLHIFRIQYSTARICANIGDMSTIQCALYCKHCAKYSAHPIVYATWTVVPSIYNVFTAPHIQASIFNWTYLGWYWRYVENSMRLIPQTWCQMLRIYSSLRYVNCGPGHIQCSYISAYSGFSMLQNVSALMLMISRQCNMRYTANWEPSTAHILQFTLCELVVPAIYSIVTAPHIQASIFSRRYLRCYWRYHDNSMRVILKTWCQV
jgi:hypothetical protein